MLLQALRPDEYHISPAMTAGAAQDLLERLERLRAGDGVCLIDFAAVAGSSADGLSILSGLLRRGVEIQLFDRDGDLLSVAADDTAGRVLRALAAVGGDAWRPKRKADIVLDLLDDDDVAEIRRLHAAGLSPRRIGLIYRRTPKAISELVLGRDRVGAGDAAHAPMLDCVRLSTPENIPRASSLARPLKRASALSLLLVGLTLATPAVAQHGGRGAGRMPQSGRAPASRGPSRPAPRVRAEPPPPARALINLSDVMAFGVIEAVDRSTGRVTIAYQPIEALNWPAGSKPFQVSKSKLLEGVEVGDKVGFKMESQQITQMQVLGARPPSQNGETGPIARAGHEGG